MKVSWYDLWRPKKLIGSFYFLEGHRLAQPPTQAPKMRAENEGHTSIHISKEPPGHVLPPLALLLAPPLEVFWALGWDLTKACWDGLCCLGCWRGATGLACCLGAWGLFGLWGRLAWAVGRFPLPLGLFAPWFLLLDWDKIIVLMEMHLLYEGP